MKYMIGQRVIYYSGPCPGVICVVCAPEPCSEVGKTFWIDNPEKGYKHWVDERNVKPLTGGQL